MGFIIDFDATLDAILCAADLAASRRQYPLDECADAFTARCDLAVGIAEESENFVNVRFDAFFDNAIEVKANVRLADLKAYSVVTRDNGQRLGEGAPRLGVI